MCNVTIRTEKNYETAGGLAMARRNQQCAQCHREQTRPFVFEHEALREGCVVCHTPHGSINSKMLVERDANLCLKCHAQVQGTGVASGDVFIGKIPHVLLAEKITEARKLLGAAATRPFMAECRPLLCWLDSDEQNVKDNG